VALTLHKTPLPRDAEATPKGWPRFASRGLFTLPLWGRVGVGSNCTGPPGRSEYTGEPLAGSALTFWSWYPFQMDTTTGAGAPYAVLRVNKRKAKALGAIAAASAHQLRQRPTPNADPDGPAPILMHLASGQTPYQAACGLLAGAERRNRETVLCREVVLSASPSYFQPGRGTFDPQRMKAWALASLAWAKREWPDQLASFCLHLDEGSGSPHAHLLVVPRVKKTEGGWKLSSKALFDRERLRDLQSSYGKALAPLGIRRGEPGSKATHSEVRQFYGAIQRAKNGIARPKPPAPPRRPPESASAFEKTMAPLLELLGVETEQMRKQKHYEASRASWAQKIVEHREAENKRWADLQAAASVAPLRRRERGTRGLAARPPSTVASLPANRLRGPH
jgi:plasmid recombination enzyme